MAAPRMLNGVASPLSIYETSTVQHHRIGVRGFLDDRIFHYCRSSDGTGMAINTVLQAPAPTANHVTETGTLTGFTAGSSVFTAVLGNTAAHINMYEDGYIKIQSSTLGLGQKFKLKKHAAVAGSGTATFETYDPITTTPTGTVTWSLTQNIWADVVAQPTTITNVTAGVCNAAVPAASTTAPVYFWCQTWGPASVLIDTSAIVAGSSMIVGANAGTLGVAVETDIKQRIAVAMEAITMDTVYVDVLLQIAP
jgi:hypothetical protein